MSQESQHHVYKTLSGKMQLVKRNYFESRRSWKPPNYKSALAASSRPKGGNSTPWKGYKYKQLRPHLVDYTQSSISQEKLRSEVGKGKKGRAKV